MDYFEALSEHAVPLNEQALAAIKDSALELDIYAMLAERLHRIEHDKPHFIFWAALYEQYGRGYYEIRFFRRKFKKHLKNVWCVYSEARIEVDAGSLYLYNSKPPVAKKIYLMGDNS